MSGTKQQQLAQKRKEEAAAAQSKQQQRVVRILRDHQLMMLEGVKMQIEMRGQNANKDYTKCKLIRALSAHSASEFNISPGRWQHV
jgi:hypothetical protein